jgi:hypothetical protein
VQIVGLIIYISRYIARYNNENRQLHFTDKSSVLEVLQLLLQEHIQSLFELRVASPELNGEIIIERKTVTDSKRSRPFSVTKKTLFLFLNK